jgi:hypothetical protein
MTKGHVLVRSPIRLVPFLRKTIDRQVSYNAKAGVRGTSIVKQYIEKYLSTCGE